MQETSQGWIGVDPETFIDRRGVRRQRILKGGTLSFNNGYGALECLARNVSPDGARLIFGETSAVPARFSLKLTGHPGWMDAEVRWRTRTEVGVRFTGTRGAPAH